MRSNARLCSVSAALLLPLLLLTQSVLAQCGPGGCSLPQQPRARVGTSAAAKPTGHLASTVRIWNRHGRWSDGGSGVLVEHGGYFGILTCSHTFDDRIGSIEVQFSDGTRQPAKLLRRDPVYDLAVLGIQKLPAVPRVGLATELPAAGRLFTACGFGGSGEGFRSVQGGFLGFARPKTGGAPDWFRIRGRVRSGDSGGPMFNTSGKLAGILWGTNATEITGTACGRLRLIFESAVPRLVRSAPGPRTRELVAVPAPEIQQPSLGIQEAALFNPPLCRPTPQPTLAQRPPIVHTDPAVTASLGRIEGDTLAIRATLQDQDQNQPQPAERSTTESLPPWIVGLLVAAAGVVGLVAWFGVLKQ